MGGGETRKLGTLQDSLQELQVHEGEIGGVVGFGGGEGKLEEILQVWSKGVGERVQVKC